MVNGGYLDLLSSLDERTRRDGAGVYDLQDSKGRSSLWMLGPPCIIAGHSYHSYRFRVNYCLADGDKVTNIRN